MRMSSSLSVSSTPGMTTDRHPRWARGDMQGIPVRMIRFSREGIPAPMVPAGYCLAGFPAKGG
jgi:hypothetical protein